MVSKIESFTCIWLDTNVDSSQENRIAQEQLQQVVGPLFTFDNIAMGEKQILKSTEESIILIVSGSFGRQIIPRIHDFTQLIAFYVFCEDRKTNEKWANQYSKASGVVTTVLELVERVSEDQMVRRQDKDGLLFSVFSLNTQKMEVRNATFMWFQLFIEVLLHMHHKFSDRKEMISFCRDISDCDEKDLAALDEFEKTHTAENAIQWYTRDTCLYRIMNKPLRAQEFDTILNFRFFIADIAKQIQSGYEIFLRTNGCRPNTRVYRGQMISMQELELMKNNIDGFLSMNSFLSTSRDRKIALRFVQSEQTGKNNLRMLFEIEIDPKLRTKPFADIRESSDYKGEYEVLIMLGAMFCIKEVFEDLKLKLWIAKVTLASEDDFQLKKIFSHMRDKIGDETNLDTLGKLLIRMDDNERAYKCYQRMVEETQLTLSDAQLGLGWASLRCRKIDEGLDHFKASLEIRKRLHGDNHPSVAEIYSFLGEAHRKKGDYNQALVYLKNAKEIERQHLPDCSSNLAATYDTMGTIYMTMTHYDFAFSCYKKVLELRQAVLPSDHPQIAAVHANLGSLFEQQEESAKAMEYYQQALDIAKKTTTYSSSDHSDKTKYKTAYVEKITILFQRTES